MAQPVDGNDLSAEFETMDIKTMSSQISPNLDSESIESTATNDSNEGLVDESQMDDVYSQVLYSINHSIDCGDNPNQKETLAAYLKQSFQYDDAKHEQCLSSINDQPPPNINLHVTVIEARNLRAKDVNGLSDPYCTIYISSDPSKQENTSIKPETLCPAWNEQFIFPIQSIKDSLHVQVWDFDADETVRGKMSKIGEVKGFRGFSKFFQEIATSSKSAGKPHDFLGHIIVPIEGIKISGEELWYSLQGRDSGTSKERGQIRLDLRLFMEKMTENLSFRERYLQYQLTLKMLLANELRLDPDWFGQLGSSSSTILQHFAAYRGLLPIATDICLWSVYGSMINQKVIDFGLLHKLLLRIFGAMENGELTDEMKQLFWHSSRIFINNSLNIIRHLRSNEDLKEDINNLVRLLMCLRTLSDKGSSIPDFNDISNQVRDAINTGNISWWDQVTKDAQKGGSEEEKLASCVDICYKVIADLKNMLIWQKKAFEKVFQIPSFVFTYRYYNQQLEIICKPVVSAAIEKIQTIKLTESIIISQVAEASGLVQSTDSTGQIDLTSGTALFELYVCLQQFQKLSSDLLESNEPLCLAQFNFWFLDAISHWLDVAMLKASTRIGKAVAVDNLVPVDSIAKHSSSAVDTASVFYQIKVFWNQLAWPDPETTLPLILRLLDDIARCAVLYAEIINSKLGNIRMQNFGKTFHVDQSVCVVINNILHIRQSIKPLASHFVQSANFESHIETCETLINNAMENITVKLEELLINVAKWMECEVASIIKKHWGAEGSMNVDVLIEYLDSNLKFLVSGLETEAFEKLLEYISQQVFNAIDYAICKDVERKRQPEHFHQWTNIVNVLVDFFFGDEASERESRDEQLSKIRHLLKLHGSDTNYLIRQYYLERMSRGEDNTLGVLAFKAMFVDNRLIIDILNARNLKKMDLKSSDPYVIVQLVLPEKAPKTPTFKTKVHRKTLFPLFDERFTFNIAEDLRDQHDSLVLLTVKDHDVIDSDDFIGEIFISFDQIAKGDDLNAINEIDQFLFDLSKPTELDRSSEYFKTLEKRCWDAEAKQFIKEELSKIAK